MTVVTSMSDSNKADRCESCGGVGILCSSQVGCLVAPFEVPSAVNVAYADGVKDERAQWAEEARAVWNAWNNGDDMDHVKERLRVMLTKARE